MRSTLVGRSGRGATSRTLSILVTLTMWLIAVVGVAAVPVGEEASLFRRAEEARAYEVATAEAMGGCTLPGLCW